MDSGKEVPETQIAGELLRRHFKKSTSQIGAVTEQEPTAVSTFFDKQYLTMREFLAPIGLEIRTPKIAIVKGTVADFFGTGLHTGIRVNKRSPTIETIRQFLSRL